MPQSTTDICRALLRELPESTDIRKPLAVAWARFRFQPNLYGPELRACMASEADDTDVVGAASLLYRVATDCPFMPGASEWVATSGPILVRFIKSSDAGLRSFACRLLVQGSVPPEAIPSLRSMVRTQSDGGAIAAAVVLSRIGSRSAQAVKLLERGLADNRNDIADAAGEALAALVEHRPDAAVAYFRALASLEPSLAYSAIKASGNPKLPRAKIVAILSRSLSEETANPGIRAFAAWKLGEVGRADAAAIDLVAKAMRGDHPSVIEGAADGIKAAGRCPPAAVEALIGHLHDSRLEVRLAAMRSLKAIGIAAAPAAPVLIGLIGVESSDDGVVALGEALGACGESVIEPLLSVLRRHDLTLLPLVAIALAVLGPQAALRAMELLKAENDIWCLASIIGVVRDMGLGAPVMMPVLGDLLEEEEDPAIAGMILGAILASGLPTKDVIPGLLRCLMLGTPELADRAECGLRAAGPEVRPVLEGLLDFVAPANRERIHRLLHAAPHGEVQRFVPFAAFNNDTVLERFALVAELLAKSGELSYKEMDSILENRKQRGLLGQRYSTSATGLRQAVKAVEAHFKLRLTTRSPGRKGNLLPKALKLADDINRYLVHKAHSRPHQ